MAEVSTTLKSLGGTMTLDQALNGPDASGWVEEVVNEHERMKKFRVWQAVKKVNVPRNRKILSTVWACKKKSDGTL